MRRFFYFLFGIMLLAQGCVHDAALDRADNLASLPARHVSVGDVDLSYRTFGQGEPLLMIMGFAGTMDLWDVSLIKELARKYTVIIYDNRGVGGSSYGTKGITIKRMAEDGAGIVDALGYEKVHVLGWSMGGLIAQELALNHPEIVDKLILMGTSCDAVSVAETTRNLMGMDTKELLSHFFSKPWLVKHPDAISRLPRPAAAVNMETIKAQADAMMNWAGTCDRLSILQRDTLIVSGTEDDILPGKLSLEMVRKINGSWLVRFKNAKHWLMYQDPQSLARTISTFLGVNEDMLLN